MTEGSRARFRATSVAGLAGLAVGLAVLLFTASHAPAAPDSAIEAVRPQLARYGIKVSLWPPGSRIGVSRAAAEATALREFGVPLHHRVSALGVTDTDTHYARVQANGDRTLLISGRKVWLVLIPNQRIPVLRGSAVQGYFNATIAVFVDADTGEYLKAVSI